MCGEEASELVALLEPAKAAQFYLSVILESADYGSREDGQGARSRVPFIRSVSWSRISFYRFVGPLINEDLQLAKLAANTG